MTCPNTMEAGCRCPEHHPGLLPHAAAQGVQVEFERALERCGPVKLHVVTLTPPQHGPPGCDGTMTCGCERCVGERLDRPRGRVRQPWEPRPARSAA